VKLYNSFSISICYLFWFIKRTTWSVCGIEKEVEIRNSNLPRMKAILAVLILGLCFSLVGYLSLFVKQMTYVFEIICLWVVVIFVIYVANNIIIKQFEFFEIEFNNYSKNQKIRRDIIVILFILVDILFFCISIRRWVGYL